MAWLLLFRHIAGFMRSGFNAIAGPNFRHPQTNSALSTSSKMS